MEANGIAKRPVLVVLRPSSSLILVMVAVGFFVWVSFGAVPVRGGVLPSAHDFLLAGAGGQSQSASEACEICHIPATGPYGRGQAMQDSVGGNGYSNFDGGSQAGSSRFCLGCHDGTISAPAWGLRADGEDAMTSMAFGVDPKDHPVDVLYRPGGEFKVITNAKIKLYNGVIRCGTCHEVHGMDAGIGGQGAVAYASGGEFPLREGTQGSRLCLECHDK